MRLTGKLLVWWLVNALHHEQGVAMGHEQVTPAATHKQMTSLPMWNSLVQLERQAEEDCVYKAYACDCLLNSMRMMR